MLVDPGACRPAAVGRSRVATTAARAGCAAAAGYGALKLSWALGATIGVQSPARLRQGEAQAGGDERWLAYWGTVLLALLAVLLLLALVRYPGSRTLRALGWIGSLLIVPGVAGLALLMGRAAGIGRQDLGGLYPGTYLVVYGCFLTLGLAFALTAATPRPSTEKAHP